MVRKVTPAQLQQLIRQQEAARRRAVANQKQAVAKQNAAIDKYNRERKQAVAKFNREITAYNGRVRAHNSRVRAHRARLQQEINRLNSQRSTPRYVTVRTSTTSLHQAYERLDAETELTAWTDRESVLADLAESEAANSAQTANALEDNADDETLRLEATVLTDELRSVSEDLHNRWLGALFSLNPQNPDAARHFCTSSREVVVKMIDLHAPDTDVLAAEPNCEMRNGQVTRRAKIQYLLARAGSTQKTIADFVDDDINDVLNLFGVFNSGTHGEAGKMSLSSLRSLKVRVEGAVQFLSVLVRPAESLAN